MKITTENFFDHYIIHPLDRNLTPAEKAISLIFSILLFPVTLVIYYLKNRNVTVIDLGKREQKFQEIAASIDRVTFPILQPTRERLSITADDVPDIINDTFIRDYYSQKLPNAEHVTVPVADPATGEKIWRLWDELTREEKIRVINTGTREHNQVHPLTPEFFANLNFFTTHGQKPFIEGDPRQSHGNDHCSRAAIFAGVFAYLYQKYHPTHDVSQQDILLSQLTAAGHDAGRQTEGPDVYDEMSGEITAEEMRNLGVTDSLILAECRLAIVDKDGVPTQGKGIIAKCVQNADSVEFARLLLNSPTQDRTGFESSRNYLDIYKELRQTAEGLNPDHPEEAVLKEGLTFKDFNNELDALREEMNDFIFQTHARDFRMEAVKAKNYYAAVLGAVNPAEFPLLNSILLKTGIKKPLSQAKQLKVESDRETAKAWLQYGLEKISTGKLNDIIATLTENEDLLTLSKFRVELEKRREAEENYLAELNKTPLNPSRFIHFYGCLSPIQKEQCREEFTQKITSLYGDPILFVQRIVDRISNRTVQSVDRVVVLDLLQASLKNMMDSGNQNARELENSAQKLLACYQASDVIFRDKEAQTTASLALHRAAKIHLTLRNPAEAKRVLEVASREILLDHTNPLFDLDYLLRDKPESSSVFLTSDCGFLRKRKMRVCKKDIQQGAEIKPYYELSLELPSHIRDGLDPFLTLIPEAQKSVVEAEYLSKQNNVYVSKDSLKMGTDLKIGFNQGIELFLGNNPAYWNQYHLMRIRIPVDTPIQRVHETLASIGLPMALMPSREEDAKNEMLARSLAFRFPERYYIEMGQKNDPKLVYENLPDEMKAVIDDDLSNSKVTLVGNDHYEIVQPEIGNEAWEKGVRAVGTFVRGGFSMNEAAHLMKKILKTGLMSSEERFQNGIMNNGCAPRFNFQTGSGNQVFGRILTKNLFTDRLNLEKLPISGQVFVMLSPQVLERMPYTYLKDRGGVRNPKYYLPLHMPQGGEVTRNFWGHEKICERKGFSETVEELGRETFPLNETMFDLNVGAKYIRKLVVWSAADRYKLLAALQREQIYHIGGVPIEKVVVVTTELKPELIEGFDEEENPERGDERSIDYI